MIETRNRRLKVQNSQKESLVEGHGELSAEGVEETRAES